MMSLLIKMKLKKNLKNLKLHLFKMKIIRKKEKMA